MTTYRIKHDGEVVEVDVEWVGDGYEATMNGRTWHVAVDSQGAEESKAQTPRETSPTPQAETGSKRSRTPEPGELLAPVSGKVLSLEVEPGDHVQAGEKVMTLEAMKMKSDITAPRTGTVESVNVDVDQKVAEGEVLLTVAEG